MNPTATFRFRRIVAAGAIAWALSAIFLALSPILHPGDYVTLPFRTTGVAGTVIVQSVFPEARAAGVEPGDRLLTIDGKSFYAWFLHPDTVLHAGRTNLYEFERGGETYRVSLHAKSDNIAAIPSWCAALYAGLLLVSVIYLAIGCVVWRLRPERAEAWALLLFCSTMSAQMSLSFDWVPIPLVGPRMLFNLPFIGATVFHLFSIYPVEPAWVVRHRGVRPLMYAVAFVLASLSLLADRLPGSLVPSLGFYFTIATSFACFTFLATERRRMREGGSADRVDVMMIGALVSFVPVLLIMVAQIVWKTSWPWFIALLWFFIFPLAVGYGIVRRQLFEIRVVAKSSAAYAAATGAIAVLFALLITISEFVVSRFNVNAKSRWLEWSFLFFGILAFSPLLRRVQRLIDRVYDRDRSAYRVAVREISEAMVSMLSMKEIGDRILVALTDTMGVERAMVLLFDAEHGVLQPAGSRGDWDDDALDTVLPADHPIVTYLLARRALSRLDFDDETDAEVREACRDVFDTLEVELLVPILFGMDLLGAIAVGHKLSGERLGVDDRQLLRTLANQSAIAIENAKAYDEIAKLNATLEARVDERTQALREAQTQLVQSEKMASLGQLVAGIAHELNNPIGFVHANLQLMDEYIRKLIESKGAGPDADRAREALAKLLARSREGTARVKKIVEDLRTFSRVDQADLQEVDLHEGLERTISLIEPRLKDGIHVERDYGDLPRIRCYAGQLNQVFMNLLINACDALGKKGTIWIRTRPIDGGVRVEIEDNGPGIPAEIQSRIFDPFFTTKPVGKGTGLGLSISHGIVERHRGRISVESEPGHGTKFVIELPLDASLQES
jgi:signal transduction histidine kinase